MFYESVSIVIQVSFNQWKCAFQGNTGFWEPMHVLHVFQGNTGFLEPIGKKA